MSGDADIYYQSAHWRALRKQCLARDHYRCVVAGCCAVGRVADHIVARPAVAVVTAQDVLSNLRTLCLSHDAQVKERRRGQSYRKSGGRFRVIGCDAEGWPNDPTRRL